MEIPESGSDQHSTGQQKSLVSIQNSSGKPGYSLVSTLNLYHHVPTISLYLCIYIYIMMGFWGGIWGTVFFFGGDELKCCCPRLEYISGCGLPLPARSKSWSLKMLTSCWWRASILGGAASLNCALDRCPPLWEHDGKTNLRCWQVCQRATRNISWVN